MIKNLQDLANSINGGNFPLPVEDATPPEIRKHHALALALLNMKQRMQVSGLGNPLVERLRVDIVPRFRPKRDIGRTDRTLNEYSKRLIRLVPKHATFSKFQVEGWQAMKSAMDDNATLVLLAPTGSGKTEVFLLPIVNHVREHVKDSAPQRYLLIYPRVELLKDQLSRLMTAVYRDKAASGSGADDLMIGIQISGISSTLTSTLNPSYRVFDRDGHFLKIKHCPICGEGQLRHEAIRVNTRSRSYLVCDNAGCDAQWWFSLSKEDHKNVKPHLMVCTAEALDRFYLDPTFEPYLKAVTGVAMDEAHLYHGVYGAHIHNLFRRFASLRGNKQIAHIASSATIVDPADFVAKLLDVPNSNVRVHEADPRDMEPSGQEIAYFVQAKHDAAKKLSKQNPALIQAVMLLGHGFFKQNERMIVFVDSVDQTVRFDKTIKDADNTKQLWRMRTLPEDITYDGHDCSCTSPERCAVFQAGECWRSILEPDCHADKSSYRQDNLVINQVSRNHQNDFMDGDVVIATPVLEVGVDDERILATIHYQAPLSGVHGFIQRRGRAGRKAGTDAHTFMVLGQTPTEQYYFYRRHRLLYGKYMLPLNPKNDIIIRMHDALEKARNEVAALTRRGVRAGLHNWLINKLRSCSLLSELYQEDLDALTAGDHLRTQLRTWRLREQPKLADRLQLRAMLREFKGQVFGEQTIDDAVANLLERIEAYGKGLATRDDVRNAFVQLEAVVGPFRYSDIRIDGLSVTDFLTRLGNLWDALGDPNDPRTPFAEQLHDFFMVLEELDEETWKLNSAPEVIRLTLRALYYLHLGKVSEHEGNCPAHIDVLVPEAYFGETKLVVVESKSGADGNRRPEKRAENVSFLSSILLPYGLTSRYFQSKDFLGTIDTTPVALASISEEGMETVMLDVVSSGIDRDATLEAQKVQVRPIKTSSEGVDAVKMCPDCYRIYSINRSAACHGELKTVKVYPEALEEKRYQANHHRTQFSRYFTQAEQVYAHTTVLGSRVTYYPCYFQEGSYRINGRTELRKQFDALYAKPLSYGLVTTGILWDMKDMLDALIKDEALKGRVKGQSDRELDETLILNTAANMLIKAIVAIAGVNATNLSYKINLEEKEVCVWENIEGGTGISQVFTGILRANPREVYQELLASVLCSVNIAETDGTTPIPQLQQQIADAWCLPLSDPQVVDLMQDVASERQTIANNSDGATLTCSANDGCPACVQSTSQQHKKPNEIPSRWVAEAIAQRFLVSMNGQELNASLLTSAERSWVPPLTLRTSEGDQTFDVLVL